MSSLTPLARRPLEKVRPYEVQEPPPGVVELDANENIVLDEEWAKSVVARAAREVDPRKYPPAYGSEAIEALSEHLGVERRNIAVSCGSDEIIGMLARAFVDPGDHVVIVEPTFEVYAAQVAVAGGVVRRVLVKPESFQLDVDAVVEASKGAKLLFLCSPNNPTGAQYERSDVEEVARRCRDCIVVIDEAYADFAGSSLMDLALSEDNVVVLRSFSKSAGMAGLRIGYAVSTPPIIEALRRVDLPFKVSSVAQRAVRIVLSEWRVVESYIEEVRRLRDELYSMISSVRGVKAYPSKANFLLVRLTREGVTSRDLCGELLKRGFLVKDRGSMPMLENCVRVTVGTREVNAGVVEAFREVVEGEERES